MDDSFEFETAESVEEALGDEVLDKLDEILLLSHGNDDHSDIAWLYNWLTEPGRTTQDIKRVLMYASWERRAFEDEGGSAIYIARTVAEALATISPVLDRRWEMVTCYLIKLFGEYPVSKYLNYGAISTSLSNWILNIAGDPTMCPFSDTRLDALILYGKYIRFSKEHHDKALTALMLNLCSIDKLREEKYGPFRQTDFVDHLLLFKKASLIKIGLKLTEKLKYNRAQRVKNLLHDYSQDYSIGLKSITQPWEVNTLVALLKYTQDGAHIVYKEFQKELAEQESELNESNEDEFIFSRFDDYKPDHVRNIHVSLDRLFFLVRIFKTVLQEPELLNNTVDCIMDVAEAYIRVAWTKDDGAKKFCLVSINAMLHEFCTITKDKDKDKNEDTDDNDEDGDENSNENEDEFTDNDCENESDSENEEDYGEEDEEIEDKPYTMDQTPVGKELIRKYKRRICNLRPLVTKDILFNDLFSNKSLDEILYNKMY